MLYIDLDQGIRVLFPGADGESNRLASGQSLRLEDRAVRTRASGKEHLLVISRPALAGRERSDFSFLAQPSLTRTRAAGDAAREALADAAFAEYRRLGLEHPRTASGTIDLQLFSFARQAVQ